ncbi:MAG: MATE family efflux transporter, partial [Victivallales bacterium]|nr:MATE family efflux transporter [Victivallales bacterium]
SVIASQFYGAKKYRSLEKTIHTAMLVAIFGGLFMAIFGLLFSHLMLEMMDSPEDVIGKSTLYMQIIFGGMMFQMLYNYGSAILRAVGDTKRPLYYLTFAGIVNVVLNLFFVLRLHMDVAGVAIATVISHAISAMLVWNAIRVGDDSFKLDLHKVSIDWPIFKRMLSIGVPAGLQGACFSFSNIVIQSSVNSFGSIVMAGNAAAMSLEGMVYIGSACFHFTALSFVGQNYGGRQYARIRKCILYALILVSIVCETMGVTCYLFGNQLLSIYNPDPDVIIWGLKRMSILFTTYALCGMMDVVCGALRGLGYSTIPALLTFFSVCVMRVVWIGTVFRAHRTIPMLMLSYPISWILATVANGALLYVACRRLNKSAKLT